MRSTPEIDARLRRRLQEAVDRFANGSADAFGRQIGYTNGGYIREVLSTKKEVRERLIERVHEQPNMRGWFSSILTPAMAPAQAGQLLMEVTPEERLVILALRDRQQAQLHEDAVAASRKHLKNGTE